MGLASACIDLQENKRGNRHKSNRFGKRASHRIDRRDAKRVIEEELALFEPSAEEIDDDYAQDRAYEDYLECYWSTDDWDEEEFLSLVRR